MSNKIDWTTFPIFNQTYTTPGQRTIDISSMPDGAVYGIFISGYTLVDGTLAVGSWTDTQFGITTYCSGSSIAHNLSNTNVYTKLSGENSLYVNFAASAGQISELSARVLVFRLN